MDQIRIKGLEIFAHHGVYPEEKEKGQHFFLDAVLYTDTRRAGLTDRLELSTDYGEVCRLMNEVMCAQTYDLIERAAEQTAQEVLLAFPLIRRLELELHKPEAPIPLPSGMCRCGLSGAGTGRSLRLAPIWGIKSIIWKKG